MNIRVMILIYKQQGETPLQSLDRLRMEKPEYADAKLSYAGRLDPMAEGLMIVLVGEECSDREKWLGMDKTYVTEILLGVGTDTGDALGKIKNQILNIKMGEWEIREELGKMVGRFEQKYPVYSSKSFAGDFESARKEETKENSHEVEIYSVELLEIKEISPSDLLNRIKTNIAKVQGDFRQEEILKIWESQLKDSECIFQVLKIRLSVSSGFYVRQFAEDFGAKFGVPALALSILRERVEAKPKIGNLGSPEHFVEQNVLGVWGLEDVDKQSF
jgi:tRNA pseudouridine(55) synthase